MFTVTFVLYEKDGLDRSEALRYWRETHGPLLRDVPGVQRYVQQHAVGAPDGAPPFLGVASLGFADAEGRPARWSTHGEWVGISTIGEGIFSTYVRGTEDGVLIDDPDPDTYGPDAWACWTGTSFAAPQVTGAVARLMTESSRQMSPRAALDALKERGTDFTAAGYGRGVRILPGTGRPSR